MRLHLEDKAALASSKKKKKKKNQAKEKAKGTSFKKNYRLLFTACIQSEKENKVAKEVAFTPANE